MNRGVDIGEAERQRLLQVMGYDIWMPRGSESLARPTPVVPARRRAERPAVVNHSQRASADTRAELRQHLDTPSTETTADPSTPQRTHRVMHSAPQPVLLVLAERVQADAPLVRQLMKVLPGCMVCTPDAIGRGLARFALQLGVDAVLPSDVLGIKAPDLEGLRRSASARRALWWAIKPILKAKRD